MIDNTEGAPGQMMEGTEGHRDRRWEQRDTWTGDIANRGNNRANYREIVETEEQIGRWGKNSRA